MRTELHNKLTATLQLMDELIDTIEKADTDEVFPFNIDFTKEQREWYRVEVGMMIDELFKDKEATLESNPPTARSTVSA